MGVEQVDHTAQEFTALPVEKKTPRIIEEIYKSKSLKLLIFGAAAIAFARANPFFERASARSDFLSRGDGNHVFLVDSGLAIDMGKGTMIEGGFREECDHAVYTKVEDINDMQIFVLDLRPDFEVKQLTDSGRNHSATLSPDCKKVAFVSNINGWSVILVEGLDGERIGQIRPREISTGVLEIRWDKNNPDRIFYKECSSACEYFSRNLASK